MKRRYRDKFFYNLLIAYYYNALELLANLSEFKETLNKLIPIDIPPVSPIISTEQTILSAQNDTLNINSCTIIELLVLDGFDLPVATRGIRRVEF